MYKMAPRKALLILLCSLGMSDQHDARFAWTVRASVGLWAVVRPTVKAHDGGIASLYAEHLDCEADEVCVMHHFAGAGPNG